MKNTLAENMLRFGTKNLNEQTFVGGSNISPDEITDPIELVLNQLASHSFRMQQMSDEYSRKYANSTAAAVAAADPAGSKRLALGMIKKIENAEKIYHDAIKQVYNM